MLNMNNVSSLVVLHGFSLKRRTTDKRGMVFRQRVDVIQRSDQRALSDVFHAVLALDVVESLSLLRARKTDQNGELNVVRVFLQEPFALFRGERASFDYATTGLSDDIFDFRSVVGLEVFLGLGSREFFVRHNVVRQRDVMDICTGHRVVGNNLTYH